MGYNPPTNDPLAVLRRRQDDLERQVREALRAAGTQPNQTTRKQQNQTSAIDGLAALVDEQGQALTGQGEALGALAVEVAGQTEAIETLTVQVEALVASTPRTDAGSAIVTGAALTDADAGWAPVVLTVPDGYTRAAVTAHATITATASLPVKVAVRVAGTDLGALILTPGGGQVVGVTGGAASVPVVGGESLHIETRASVPGGTGTAQITTAASVTFTKTV